MTETTDAALLRAAIVAHGIPSTRGRNAGQPSVLAFAERIGVNGRTVRRWLAAEDGLVLEPWPREQCRTVLRNAKRRAG